MKHFTLALATFAALTLSVPVRAETPADTLVIADTIDDVVSLDPAESFEFSGQDALENVYDRLIQILPANDFKLEPGLAESWSVSEDGKTYTFKIKEGRKFHSGNPVTAEDAAWSLQRVVKLNKTPSFILTQFGFTPENVDGMIKATSPTEFTITTDKAYAQSFFYNILTAIVASVVDKQEALAHEQNGDMGYEWLKTNSAGSGPYMLRSWKPNDSIVLEGVEGYWGGGVALKRVFIRHVPEGASRRLLLEQGDVDISRRLPPNDAQAIAANPDLKVLDEQRGRIFYLAGNQKHEALAKPQVMEALKYLIDYDGMAISFLKGQFVVHQAFLPVGFLGALEEKPYKLDVQKAKQLLAESGFAEGIDVTIDFISRPEDQQNAQLYQQMLGAVGIRATLQPSERIAWVQKTLSGSYDFRTFQSPVRPEPDFMLSNVLSENGPSNYMNWQDEEIQGKLREARTTYDTARRQQLYEQVQNRIADEAYMGFTWRRSGMLVASKAVQNVAPGWTVPLTNSTEMWLDR